MGTRSLIRFVESGQEICCIYQQFDGYPSGVGATLADFLASGRMVNGIPVSAPGRMFNGMGCLAAQFIRDHKLSAGGLYLYAPGSRDCGEEYVYVVTGGLGAQFDPVPLSVSVFEDEDKAPVYSGDVEGFAAFCNETEAA